MKQKKSGGLRHIFKRAAIASAFAIAASPFVIEGMIDIDDRQRKGGAPLTAGETALVRSVFGDAVNTDKVRKHFGPPRSPTAASVAGGSTRHIDFWGPNQQSEDFSRDRGWKQGVFMHEIAHIWQHQNSLTLINNYLRGCKTYDYQLTENSEFGDFCIEQQASIVQDYVNRILYPYFGRTGIYSDADRELARVVEEQFPQARITRLEREEAAKQDNNHSVTFSINFTHM